MTHRKKVAGFFGTHVFFAKIKCSKKLEVPRNSTVDNKISGAEEPSGFQQVPEAEAQKKVKHRNHENHNSTAPSLRPQHQDGFGSSMSTMSTVKIK